MTAITANFTWTPEEFRRMRNAWLRYTKQGRIHRRNVWLMFLFGVAGLTAGVAFLIRDGVHFPEIMLIIASFALLAFLYLARMRTPQEVLSRLQIRWSISPEQVVIESGTVREEFEWPSIRRMIRTPDGFLMWRGDGFERWLPKSALAQSVVDFSRLAESKVAKYENAA